MKTVVIGFKSVSLSYWIISTLCTCKSFVEYIFQRMEEEKKGKGKREGGGERVREMASCTILLLKVILCIMLNKS